MERRRTSTPIVGSYFFSNSPVECLFTKVVLPVPPSPTRISLKFGTLSGTFIPARAYTSSQTHTSQNTRNNTITKSQHRTTSFASQNAAAARRHDRIHNGATNSLSSLLSLRFALCVTRAKTHFKGRDIHIGASDTVVP